MTSPLNDISTHWWPQSPPILSPSQVFLGTRLSSPPTSWGPTQHLPSCPRAFAQSSDGSTYEGLHLCPACLRTAARDTCSVPAHLYLLRAPRDRARVHGALGPWPPGAVPCRWVGSVGCLAGVPRTQAMDQGQHATESPGLSPPHSPEMRTRKEMGWM